MIQTNLADPAFAKGIQVLDKEAQAAGMDLFDWMYLKMEQAVRDDDARKWLQARQSGK